MSIESRLRKISAITLAEYVQAKVGPTKSCLYPADDSLGAAYLEKVRDVFIGILPDDDSDTYVHVKTRDDQRWGLDIDSVIPYRREQVAVDLGLLSWPWTPVLPSVGKARTAGEILVEHLREYTYTLVTVLAEQAVKAYEAGPETFYVAIINTPGYLPENEPEEFETIAEAWGYLVEERKRQEDDFEEDGYSNTYHRLVELSKDAEPECGSVYGNTPGYEGDHDQGLVYTVTIGEG